MLLCGATLDAQHGRRVEIGEEYQDVVLLMIALEVLDERRAPRALLPQPLHLVFAGVGVVEDPFGVAVEGLDVARAARLRSGGR